MFCKNCGKEINETSKFCKFCGTRIVPQEFLSPKRKVSFVKKINFINLIFNRFIIILFGIIFFIWLVNDPSYNTGGTKTPLPQPVTQFTEESDSKENNIPFSLSQLKRKEPDLSIKEPDGLDLSAFDMSLANGTILKKKNYYLSGHGELEIKNGTDLDAVAKLILGSTSILTVYIKANSNYTMSEISDGTYWLIFAQGLNWDSTTQKFRRNEQYSAFDETFDFITTEDDKYYYPPGFEVTLNPVVGGNAETSSVDPQQFNAY